MLLWANRFFGVSLELPSAFENELAADCIFAKSMKVRCDALSMRFFYGVGCQNTTHPIEEHFSFYIRRTLPRVLPIGSHLWTDVMTRMMVAAWTIHVSSDLDNPSVPFQRIR